MKRPHIDELGRFQSDKYPTTPAGKCPLSVEDPTAQDLLWEYAQRRRPLDAEFADDLEFALLNAGYPAHVAAAPRRDGELGNLGNLIDALRASWDIDTAAADTERAGHGKPHGQCAVTALVVQDYLGGTLMRCEFPFNGGSHYWNLIPAVGEIDLTREQYEAGRIIPRGGEIKTSNGGRSRLLEGERAIAARTPERYALLAKRVRAYLEAR